jgi:hypothetical protein
MLKGVATKVGWVGRATSMVFGLALVLALLFGVASMALAGTGANSVFNLGVKNTVDAVTQLVSNTDAGPAGPMLRVDNNSSAAGATGVQILTEAGKPPMKVNSQARVTNLNAALAGRADSAASADFAADKLDGKAASELPGTVVQTVDISGAVSTTIPFEDNLSFVAPTATVTTSSTQRFVGVVSAPFKLDSGGPLNFTYGICLQQVPSIFLNSFSGNNNPLQGMATTTRTSWTAAQTTVLGEGTYEVGLCADNTENNAVTLGGDDRASGWIEVMNPTP